MVAPRGSLGDESRPVLRRGEGEDRGIAKKKRNHDRGGELVVKVKMSMKRIRIRNKKKKGKKEREMLE